MPELPGISTPARSFAVVPGRSRPAGLGRARAHPAKNDADGAIENYDKAPKLAPKSTAALVNRGGAYASKGDADRAEADYATAIKIDPRNAAAYGRLGVKP